MIFYDNNNFYSKKQKKASPLKISINFVLNN